MWPPAGRTSTKQVGNTDTYSAELSHCWTETTPVEEQVAGEQVAGEQVASEQVASEEVAGEQVAGEEVAGEQVAVEQVAVEQVAVEQVAVEQVAVEQVAVQQRHFITRRDRLSGSQTFSVAPQFGGRKTFNTPTKQIGPR